MPLHMKKQSDSVLATMAPAISSGTAPALRDGASLGPAPVTVRRERPPWATKKLDQRIIEGLVTDDSKLFRELSQRGVNEASIREHAHTLGMTKEFIKQCRLSGSRPAMRSCIKCDATFLSSGIHNRLCPRCPRR
jgi:hypothetical protein